MKPVLVHYIGVDNVDFLDIPIYIERVKDLCHYDNEYHTVFLAVRGKDTRIECLNPMFIEKGEEKRKIINSINKIKHDTKEMIDNHPYLSRNILLTERV